MLAAGLGAGLIGLVYFDRWFGRRTRRGTGPGTATAAELGGDRSAAAGAHGQAGRLAMLIAVGIGPHDFAEGLAIGGSAAKGDLGRKEIIAWGIFLGLAAGFLADAIVTAAGA